MFEIKGLNVAIGGRRIIEGLALSMRKGQVHVIMGPNGAGKTSLAAALMGRPGVEASGSVTLDGKEMLGLPPDERARSGMFLAFQNPEEIEGVKASNLVRKAVAAREGRQDVEGMMRIQEGLVASAESLGMDKAFVSRELNVGFSGGEKKRMEMLQMLALRPKVAILDEVDSGLDVDGVRLVAKAIAGLNDGKRCFLIITHYPRILKHLKADAVHILADGKLVLSGGEELAHEIEEKGYSSYLKGGKA